MVTDVREQTDHLSALFFAADAWVINGHGSGTCLMLSIRQILKAVIRS